MCICSWSSRPAYSNHPDVLDPPQHQLSYACTHSTNSLAPSISNSSKYCCHRQCKVPLAVPLPVLSTFVKAQLVPQSPVPRCAGPSVRPVKGVGRQMGKGRLRICTLSHPLCTHYMHTLALANMHPLYTRCLPHNAHPLVLHIITFQDPSDSLRDR